MIAERPERLKAPSLADQWFLLLVLWLAGLSMRVTILAVPPVLPLIHRDLGLDETGIAALTGLPVLVLAAAALPGSLLIARLGARRALLTGLLLVGVGAALRGAGPTLPVLFGMTVLMGVGVAVLQPTLPSLVRLWFPGHVGPATAGYTNGLLIGEIVAAALTLPFLLPALGGSWPLVLAAWSIPVFATALLALFGTRQPLRKAGQARPRWQPDWRDSRTWLLSLILGSASILYFGTNAFLPDFLHATGRAGLTAAALAATNAGQLPASFLVALFPRALVGRKAPLIPAGALALGGVLGLALLPGSLAVACSAVIGFCTAFVLVLSLALPPLLAGPDDVHRLSAAMFTISYALAFIGPIVGGALWDLGGDPRYAFVPALLAALTVLLLPTRLHMPGDREPAVLGANLPLR